MSRTTKELIYLLSGEIAAVKPVPSPLKLLLSLNAVLVVYAFAVGAVLGLRPDLALQLHRTLYVSEILLLAFTGLSSVSASVYLAFPDRYQHPYAAQLPFYGFIAFVLLLCAQVFLPFDPRMTIPVGPNTHGFECTLCVAAVAALPAMVLLYILRKGASVTPKLSGLYALLGAASTGCLVLRLSEVNDSLAHLALWHYIPTLAFAALGGWMGKRLLKW